MKRIETYLGVALTIFAIGFNLWLYRLEPTAQVDPNDNTFQFALVYRTNQIWDYAAKKCSYNPLCFFSYLADHWVPNWNEGYNVPHYYSHVPQILIVASHRLTAGITHLSLFSHYHWIIYLLLCLFPLSVFLALLVAGLSPIAAGFGAILASHISTDGLYGLDPSSFLWRGYGLSSQLFAMVWLPLAIACIYKKKLIPAIIFLVLTTSGHLGIGIMAFLSLIPLLFREPKKLLVIAIPSIFILSYWIVPALLTDNFHNFSFWDPVWKFNSYGAKEILARLFNGDVFDYGRLPVFTALVLLGLFIHPSFALLFVFWLLLYFGRTTWGGLIDLVPALKEFHLSRFIVGVHVAGLFLAPFALEWIASRLKNYRVFLYGILGLILLIPIYRQTVHYNELNETLIKRANENYGKQSIDANALVSVLQNFQKTAPGRVFSGRGGAWGKEFKLAETNMTMYLGNFAIPTVLWLPETWSPNGDTEQYFREDKQEDYDLFNIRYVATPKTLAKENIQPFWRRIQENPSWNLYEVTTSGYFTPGIRPAIVAADKYSRTNVVRLWIQSDDPKRGLFTELTFDTKKYPVNVGIPNFKMLDDVTFAVPGGSIHNLFHEPPRYVSPLTVVPIITLSSQTNELDMVFSTKAEIPESCTGECLVILKQTFHPNWRVTVDGTRVSPIITFPFYIGIPVSPGSHTIVASYEPSQLKVILLTIEFLALLGGIILLTRKR